MPLLGACSLRNLRNYLWDTNCSFVVEQMSPKHYLETAPPPATLSKGVDDRPPTPHHLISRSGSGTDYRIYSINRPGRLLNFCTLRVGAYSRWALIRGWALIKFSPFSASLVCWFCKKTINANNIRYIKHLRTTKLNFEKTVRLTSFQKHNGDPFQIYQQYTFSGFPLLYTGTLSFLLLSFFFFSLVFSLFFGVCMCFV